jgi:hypothetical protein
MQLVHHPAGLGGALELHGFFHTLFTARLKNAEDLSLAKQGAQGQTPLGCVSLKGIKFWQLMEGTQYKITT